MFLRQMTAQSLRSKALTSPTKQTERSYLVIEQSETRAGQNVALNQSSDGGLGYQTMSLPGATMSGQALSVTAQIDLEDIGAVKTGSGGLLVSRSRCWVSILLRLIKRAARTL